MTLRRGEVQGFDFNRMIVEFTMLNQDKVIRCAISTAAMDDLEGRRDVKPHQRDAPRPVHPPPTGISLCSLAETWDYAGRQSVSEAS